MRDDHHDPAGPSDLRERPTADAAPEIGSGASATDQGKARYVAGDRAVHPDDRTAASSAHVGGGVAGGAIAGATAGSVVAFPFGTVVGAVAGAVGGWWAGAGAADKVEYTAQDDRLNRAHWESSPHRLADRDYEGARPAYQLGHLARHNPDYAGRDFASVESDLRHGWTEDHRARYGDWETVRGFAEAAYAREEPLNPDVAVTPGTWGETLVGQPKGQVNPNAGLTQGGTTSHQRATFNDPAGAEEA